MGVRIPGRRGIDIFLLLGESGLFCNVYDDLRSPMFCGVHSVSSLDSKPGHREDRLNCIYFSVQLRESLTAQLYSASLCVFVSPGYHAYQAH
jgi:hypothetical protein